MSNMNSIALINDPTKIDNLKQAKELVRYLEQDDVEKADSIINAFCETRENEMFQEVGKLTRDLHETINDLGGDERLSSIMHEEMPDARHNLSHVIDLTEDAANKTLTAIEHSAPLLDGLSERAHHLQNVLRGHIKKLVEDNRLTFIEEELDAYLDMVDVDIKDINKDMNTILLAQGYQDLSGQIIQRVSKMVQELEHSMVSILKINSHYENREEKKEVVKDNSGYGPSVPGIENGDVMKDQDDVDDLLSSLGF